MVLPVTVTRLPDLAEGRWSATATRLPDGRVLVAGGYSYAAKNTLRSADLIDPLAGTIVPAAPFLHDRNFATATLLPDGTVLVAGGFSEHCATLDQAEIYHPQTDRWISSQGFLHDRRELFTATTLLDRTVLLVGGLSLRKRGTLSTAERYDPQADKFLLTKGSLATDRFGHEAVRLDDGRVLIVGGKSWKIGEADRSLAEAELYLPESDGFTPAGSLALARDRPTASLLADGRVLIAGGSNADGTPAACEEWNSTTGTFLPAAPLNEGRMAHAAVCLPDGRVLVAGGWSETRKATTPTAELYDPQTDRWTLLSPDLPFAAHDLCLVALPDGRVLALSGKHSTGDEATASAVATVALLAIPPR